MLVFKNNRAMTNGLVFTSVGLPTDLDSVRGQILASLVVPIGYELDYFTLPHCLVT